MPLPSEPKTRRAGPPLAPSHPAPPDPAPHSAPDSLADRRRPGRHPDAAPDLLPLLRYRPPEGPRARAPTDDLAPARGIPRAGMPEAICRDPSLLSPLARRSRNPAGIARPRPRPRHPAPPPRRATRHAGKNDLDIAHRLCFTTPMSEAAPPPPSMDLLFETVSNVIAMLLAALQPGDSNNRLLVPFRGLLERRLIRIRDRLAVIAAEYAADPDGQHPPSPRPVSATAGKARAQAAPDGPRKRPAAPTRARRSKRRAAGTLPRRPGALARPPPRLP